MTPKEIRHIDIEQLPTLPAIAMEAIRMMEGDHSNFAALSTLLKNDQVLTARILHYANTARVSARKVASLSQALSLLGFRAVRTIVLSASVFDFFSTHNKIRKDKLVAFWLHAAAVAITAEILADRLGFADPEEAYIAGLLHDIGKLVCYLLQPEEFAELCAELDRQGSSSVRHNAPLDLEKAHLGTNHIDAGLLAARKWKLPEQLTASIWLHHQPVTETILPGPAGLSQLIRFADVLCTTHAIGNSYFLCRSFHSHDSFLFALENLVRQHHLTPEDITEIMEGVTSAVRDLGEGLGFWDESSFAETLNISHAGLTRISMEQDRKARQLEQTNRVLEITNKMTRSLHAGLSIPETASVIAQAAAHAFGGKSSLCLIRDENHRSFAGSLYTDGVSEDIDIPSQLTGNQEFTIPPEAPAIETAAIKGLQRVSMEATAGRSVETCLSRAMSGSRFMAAFFMTDNQSSWTDDCVLGELVVDFAGTLIAASEDISYLSRQFETFAITASRNVERLLLEKNLATKAAELAAASRKMEENQRQLFHSNRLATVGQLAAGAAHEINNPLTIISLNVQIMRHALAGMDDTEAMQQRLTTIAEQEKRISKIISDLMGYARPAQPRFSAVSVADIVGRVLSVLGDRISLNNINLSNTIAETIPLVMVDHLQIEQVFMNLAVNACHAMPNGGTLSFSAAARDRVVEVSVTDTGTGIDPKDLPRIFDPFFTTKKQGEGTGLGLAVCNSIAELNGGAMSVASTPDKGTTFTLSLPQDKGGRLREMKAGLQKQEPPPVVVEPKRHRILVVDDERLLNDMIQDALREQGYEVEGAYDGMEGIGRLRYEKFDLILLDIRMPRKDGLEVLQFVKEFYPEIKVIIITGLASKNQIEETVSLGAAACLKKPFQLEKVLETISRVLKN